MPYMAAVQIGPRIQHVPVYSTSEIDSHGDTEHTVFIPIGQKTPDWGSPAPTFTDYYGSLQPSSWDQFECPGTGNPNRAAAQSMALDPTGAFFWMPEFLNGALPLPQAALWMVDQAGNYTPFIAPVPLAPFGAWRDVAVGPTGIVYIAEDASVGPAQGGVVTYDPGTATWGRIVVPPGAAAQVRGVAVDGSGNIVVNEATTATTYVLSPAGVVLGSAAWPVPGPYTRIAVDSSNNIWSWGLNTRLVARCANLPGMAVTTYDVGHQCVIPSAVPSPYPASFDGSITVDASDNVWVTANDGDNLVTTHGYIARVSPLGVVTLFDVWTLCAFFNYGPLTAAPTPYAVAAAPDGTIYAAIDAYIGNTSNGEQNGDLLTLRPGFGPAGEDVVELYPSSGARVYNSIGMKTPRFKSVGKLMVHNGRVWACGHDFDPIMGGAGATISALNKLDVSQWRAVLTPPPGKAIVVTGINYRVIGSYNTATLMMMFRTSRTWVVCAVINTNFPQHYFPPYGVAFIRGAVDEPLEVRGPGLPNFLNLNGIPTPSTNMTYPRFGTLYGVTLNYRLV